MTTDGGHRAVLGIVGDSGAGKSTLAAGVIAVLGEERAALLCLDDYHRYDRARRRELGITAVDPACNHLELVRQHLKLLRRGETVFKPTYDHHTGTFGPPEHFTPHPALVVYGLLGYHTEALAEPYDLRLFLDPDQGLRVRWKTIRDTRERGYTEEEVRRQLEARADDAERWIRPQAERAHIVVRFYPRDAYWESLDHRRIDVTLRERPSPGGSLLRELMEEAAAATTREGEPPWVRLERSEDDGQQRLTIEGAIPNRLAAEVEDTIWQRMPDLASEMRGRSAPIGRFDEGGVLRHSNALGLTQLLVACCVARRAGLAGQEAVPAG